MEFKRSVQSLLTGCSNQRQVRTPPQPIISQGITFKDPLHGNTTLLLYFDDQLRHERLTGLLPNGPFSPRLSSGDVESALRTPPIHLLSVAEVVLPSPRLLSLRHPARLLQWFSSDLVSQTDLPAPQAPMSSSTPVIPQSSLLHSSRPWILSRVSYLLYSAPPGVRLQFCHISISSSHIPTFNSLLAPPTDIHHGNIRPGSSLRMHLDLRRWQAIPTSSSCSSFSLFRLITIYATGRRFMQPSGSIAIGRRFMQPSGSHTPLASIYKHALASISILSLVRHSSNHLDTVRCSPSSPDLTSAIHASSVITRLSLASALLGEDVPNQNPKMFIQTYFILSVYISLRGPSAKEIIFH
ncbi:hypothetical protein CHARACLAT_001685 [Characodon lateralis]|uniref:Uncharacterized protein n=1 Tax=Characodon lateralis TaxID=208331 RepID=A0ABU7CTX7_9TELE|nr:hypothetical protein [Characodon lateralis]